MGNRVMQTQETEIALVKQELRTLAADVKELRDERDKALKAGIRTLGAFVIAMALYIWNFFVNHLVGK